MTGLSDYQLNHATDNAVLDILFSDIEDEYGKKIFELSEEESSELRKVFQLDVYSLFENEALLQHLANLFPLEISSEEVITTVKRYCVSYKRVHRDLEDSSLSQISEYLSTQFYAGDQSVTLIRRFGKEKQEYISDAFLYVVENNQFNV
jgi:hypothetical protein